MDSKQLAADAVALIAPALPYLLAFGGKAAEGAADELGAETWKAARALWQRLRPAVEAQSGGEQAVRELVEASEDPDLRTALRVHVKRGVGQDRKLLEELRRLLDQARRSPEIVAHLEGSGTIVQGDRATGAGREGVAVGRAEGPVTVDRSTRSAEGDLVEGDRIEGGQVYVIKESRIVVGEPRPEMRRVDRESALGKYLDFVLRRNRYLQLQGIRSGGRLLSIELDRIYVTLRTAGADRLRDRRGETDGATAPIGKPRIDGRPRPAELAAEEIAEPATGPVSISVNEALEEGRRLVVLGDPGSGKTTLLRYLALTFARGEAESPEVVADKLGLPEGGLPLLLPLRQADAYLAAHSRDDGTTGPKLLIDFLLRWMENERVALPDDFFDSWLEDGRAVVLLDGLDEVADPGRRAELARVVESLVRAYPRCRYVVTSRIVGYTGSARLGEEFRTTTIKPFDLAEVRRFLSTWHRLVAAGQMGPGEASVAHAERQTEELLASIRENDRIRELAVNPLLLTVIAPRGPPAGP